MILPLAELLARHGRIDEAIEVLRPIPHAAGAEGEWLVRSRSWTDRRRATRSYGQRAKLASSHAIGDRR
ncbi:hypothetical protein [Streptomyces chromofuscus]|uniref:hypothetical protein n=1 Tax=Streptomyces chromofuscus TaxID=42881 RepID=UPI003570D5EC